MMGATTPPTASEFFRVFPTDCMGSTFVFVLFSAWCKRREKGETHCPERRGTFVGLDRAGDDQETGRLLVDC